MTNDPSGSSAPIARFPSRVRFWVYANGGPVRITLREGQRLAWSSGRRPTEEGWSEDGASWHYANGVVRRVSWSDGVDCDGRLACEERAACLFDRLAAGPADIEGTLLYGQGVRYPAWERVNGYQRDYTAEAAGY